jgi:phage baseplate assembly protein gpV
MRGFFVLCLALVAALVPGLVRHQQVEIKSQGQAATVPDIAALVTELDTARFNAGAVLETDSRSDDAPLQATADFVMTVSRKTDTNHDALDTTCHVAPGGHIRVSHVVCNPNRCLYRRWTGNDGVSYHRCKLLDTNNRLSCTCCDCNDGAHSMCPAGKHRNLPTGACDSCGIGRYAAAKNDKDACDACAVGTSTNTQGAVECESCPGGKFQPAQQSKDCDMCQPGSYTHYKEGTACLSCAKGTYQSHENQSGCMLCSAGTFAAATGATKCDVCGAKTWQPTAGKTECRPVNECSAVQYETTMHTTTSDRVCASHTLCTAAAQYTTKAAETHADRECARCPGCHFCDGETKTKCASGSAQDGLGDDQSQCDACQTGQYAGGKGFASSEVCPKGFLCHVEPGGHISHPHMVCSEGSCTATDVRNPDDRCLYRHWTGNDGVLYHRCKLLDTNNRLSCTCCDSNDGAHNMCPAGKHRNLPTGVCDSCGIGRYAAAKNDKDACDACAVGTFTNTQGAVECESCPGGKFQPAQQSKDCDMCQPGSYTQYKEGTACLSCAKGTYQSHENQSGCMLCSAGTFAAATGATKCDVCGAKTWQPTAGKTECRPVNECSAVQYETTMHTTTSDRVCASHTLCTAAAQYTTKAAETHAYRECARCPGCHFCDGETKTKCASGSAQDGLGDDR